MAFKSKSSRGFAARTRAIIEQNAAQGQLLDDRTPQPKTGELFVTVLEAHIKDADKSATNNPIARAIRDAMPQKNLYVATWPQGIRIGGHLFQYPPGVHEADRQWVQTLRLEPFTFKIDKSMRLPEPK